jgi:hypothetical protein
MLPIAHPKAECFQVFEQGGEDGRLRIGRHHIAVPDVDIAAPRIGSSFEICFRTMYRRARKSGPNLDRSGGSGTERGNSCPSL